MKNLISALDLGSSKIKLLVVAKKGDLLEAVFQEEENSEGIKKGVILEPKRTAQVIRKLIDKANQKLKTKISSVYSSIGGEHLTLQKVHSSISVSRADQVISEEDVERAFREIKNIEIGHNKEIVEIIPHRYIIDQETQIKDPVGLKGKKLEVESVLIAASFPYLENHKQAIEEADLELLDIFPAPLAAVRATLTQRQKEWGVSLVDIGAETTSLVAFEDGFLSHLRVFPVGFSEITNEIALNLKVDPEIAEEIKIEYGCCFWKGKNVKQRIEIDEEKPLIFYQKFLARLIRTKVLKILELINQELKKISKEKKFPAGLFLTGGGAKLAGITELSKTKFQLNCKIGRPKEIKNLEEDPALATLAGIILLSQDLEKEIKREKSKGFFGKLKNLFKIFTP